MEKKKIIILIAILTVIAIISSAYLVVLNSYTLYKDSNIEVEVPYRTQFNTSEIIGLGIVYTGSTGINICINKSDSQNTYDQLKKQFKEQYKNPITQTKYKGEIYTKSESDGTNYIIILYFDNEKTIVTLKAKNLDTIIRMAETFKLAEGFDKFEEEEENNADNNYISASEAILRFESALPIGAPGATATLTTFMGRPMYKVSCSDGNYGYVDAVTGIVYDIYGQSHHSTTDHYTYDDYDYSYDSDWWDDY